MDSYKASTVAFLENYKDEVTLGSGKSLEVICAYTVRIVRICFDGYEKGGGNMQTSDFSAYTVELGRIRYSDSSHQDVASVLARLGDAYKGFIRYNESSLFAFRTFLFVMKQYLYESTISSSVRRSSQ
jgi:hypothetical protein